MYICQLKSLGERVMKEFLISFVGLKLGKHRFEYQINKLFFESFDYHQFEDIAAKVKLTLDKKENLLELSFKYKGNVNIPCDLTGVYFDLPIKGKLKLIVQFGEEYNDDNEEILIIPHGEFQINVAQYIYETIVLSVPLKRVHPGVKDGSIDVSNYQKYVAYKADEEEIQEEIDPRWEKLKDLLKDNNK